MRNGMRYIKWESDECLKMQLLLLQSRILGVLKELHNRSTGGHFRVMKTLQKVMKRLLLEQGKRRYREKV